MAEIKIDASRSCVWSEAMTELETDMSLIPRFGHWERADELEHFPIRLTLFCMSTLHE